MSYKSIILTASGSVEDTKTAIVAARLAKRAGSQIRCIPVFPDLAADLVYYGVTLNRAVESAAVERVRASEQVTQERLETVVREAAQREGLAPAAIIVEKRELHPAFALAPAATLADLVVFGAHAVRESLELAGIFAETLLTARAPLLLVKNEEFEFGPAAIAWDGSAQAGRAVRAAMPLLQAARGVLVITNTEGRRGDALAASLERLRGYLALHGVEKVMLSEIQGDNVATSLLDAAVAEHCDMLVSGAYGRPRLFELALGGTTRALVNAKTGPHLLLAH